MSGCTEDVAAPVQDHRRAVAERNLAAILDAAEALLERREAASIAAVAAEAGVSRPTVYAHFPTREGILEAVVERAVSRSMAAYEAAEPDSGPAAEALERVIAASWTEIDRHSAIGEAAMQQLSSAAMDRAHESGFERVRALVDRGRAEGSFRTDVPAEWIVTCFFSLVHAAGAAVRQGHMKRDVALEAITLTLRDLFSGGASSSGSSTRA
jgi:TetR/AcrR family transcriptional regulator, mexCD-oprJ operon repressor